MRAYILGPRDQITLMSSEAEEIAKAFRVDDDGEVNLPLIGRVRAAGLTTEQLEAELTKRLQVYFRNPSVSVSISEYGSQPVSVIGAVGLPGVYQLRGERSLVEVLSLAGGLRQDAGGLIRITRERKYGRLPLSNVEEEPSGKVTSGVINASDLLRKLPPENNITIMPNDFIAVSAAQMVYVLGDVTRSGSIVLNERETISALRAVSMAGGLLRSAGASNARILRNKHGSSEREEIPINLQRIARGKDKDLTLQAQDILYIPSSTTKRVMARAAEAAMQAASGVAIFTAAR